MEVSVLAGERLGFRGDDRYRTAPERLILEQLHLYGWAFETGAVDEATARAAAKTALDGWVEMGLPVRRDARNARFFDPIEVVNFAKWAGRAGLHPFWRDRFVPTSRNLVMDLAARRRHHPDSGFNVALTRRFDVTHYAPGTRLRLRVPLPLAGAYHPRFAVSAASCSSPRAVITVVDGRLDVRVELGNESMVEIGAEVGFTIARPAADPVLTLAERDLYLRPSEGFVRVSPAVLALSSDLAHGRHDPWATVQAYWNHLLDAFCLGQVHYDQVSAETPCDSVLRSGWYDCELGSALLVALCRARGIPARLVSGYFLYPLAPTNHFWAEIWFADRGWLPFDLYSWDLSVGGTDPAWRGHFAGSLEPRLVTQCFPLAFTGPMSIRLPAAWTMTQRRRDGGVEIAMRQIDGSPIYTDLIRVAAADER